MTLHGRSLDDMPLAAYSSGVVPDEAEEPEPDADPGWSSVPSSSASTYQEAAAAVQPEAAAPEAAVRTGPRFSLPFHLPAVFRRRAPIDAESAPFQPVHRSSEPVQRSFEPVLRSFEPAQAMAAHVAVASGTPSMTAGTGGPRYGATAPAGAAPGASGWAGAAPGGTSFTGVLARVPPRLREPRVVAAGVVAIGLVLLALSILGGGGPSLGGGPSSSQGASASQPIAAPPGNASIEVTSGKIGLYELAGQTGAGPAVESRIDATWGDAAGHTLGLVGLASQGTRTTAADFVLTWTVAAAGGAPVTFKSMAGECTIGMAVTIKAVNGSINCKRLKSTDGNQTIDFRGTYKT
jgi:hypothetical protein